MFQINQNRVPLLEAMKEYANKDIASFDVPGHKRGRGNDVLNQYYGEHIMRLDTNSLPLLDHVGNPTGVIKEAQQLLAEAYGADAAFFMANGSTSAIQAMLLAVLRPNDKILIPKNIHKSALNGLILSGAIPVYMQPEICEIEGIVKNVTVREVERHLEMHPDAKAVFVLNPTYFGHVSKLNEISELCHKKGVFLLADEAHGAHFPFHQDMPSSAIMAGADISAVSVHKTGGALTQASTLLVKKDRVNLENVRNAVNILQSTSVSYLLMGSLDGARYNLVQNGEKLISQVLSLRQFAKEEINKIEGFSVVDEMDYYDKTKLLINTTRLSITGFQVYELLWQKYDVQLELCETGHVLAIISLGDEMKDITKLIEALNEIAELYYNPKLVSLNEINLQKISSVVKMSPRDAHFSPKKLIDLSLAVGCISAESIMAYPPGIPLISPGEMITSRFVDLINDLKAKEAFIVDNVDPELKKIMVVSDHEGVVKYV